MRTPTKVLVAIAVAGIAAAGGTAFTAGNTGINVLPVAGYQSATVTGVAVQNVAYNYDDVTPDISMLKSIVFTNDTDVTTAAYTRLLTINGPTNASIACSAAFAAGVGTITCLTPGQTIAGVASIALTVAHVGP